MSVVSLPEAPASWQEEVLEQSNTWVEEVLDRCSKCAPLGARECLRSPEIGPSEGQNTPYWRDMSLFGVAMCRLISSYAHFSSEMLSLALLGGF